MMQALGQLRAGSNLQQPEAAIDPKTKRGLVSAARNKAETSCPLRATPLNTIEGDTNEHTVQQWPHGEDLGEVLQSLPSVILASLCECGAPGGGAAHSSSPVKRLRQQALDRALQKKR